LVKSQPVLIWVEVNDLLSITDCNIVFINESLKKRGSSLVCLYRPESNPLITVSAKLRG